MIWTLVFFVSIISFIHLAKQDREYFAALCLLVTLVSVILVTFFMSEGMMTYPSLVGRLHRVKALQWRISDIATAIYPEQPGRLIAGSLTNLQQSSKLSDYLRQVAEEEAAYNSMLARARFYKRDYMWLVFGHGFFISDKIFQLPKVKSVGFCR